MNRRKFLTLSGLGAIAVTVPSVGLMATSMEDAATGILKKEFDYLNLDEEGLQLFVQDYLKNFYNRSLNVRLQSAYLLGLDSSNSDFVANMSRQYLNSSDFFINKMDTSKKVKYIGEYDPYKRPCANPFSSAYYPQDNSNNIM